MVAPVIGDYAPGTPALRKRRVVKADGLPALARWAKSTSLMIAFVGGLVAWASVLALMLVGAYLEPSSPPGNEGGDAGEIPASVRTGEATPATPRNAAATIGSPSQPVDAQTVHDDYFIGDPLAAESWYADDIVYVRTTVNGATLDLQRQAFVSATLEPSGLVLFWQDLQQVRNLIRGDTVIAKCFVEGLRESGARELLIYMSGCELVSYVIPNSDIAAVRFENLGTGGRIARFQMTFTNRGTGSDAALGATIIVGPQNYEYLVVDGMIPSGSTAEVTFVGSDGDTPLIAANEGVEIRIRLLSGNEVTFRPRAGA